MEGFYTKRLEATDLEKRVVQIRICANELTQNDNGRRPINHWVAYLELAGGGSIKIDMSPGGGRDYLTGILMLESNAYNIVANYAVRRFFEFIQPSTVNTIIALITQNKRDRYKFTEHGEGCRYWIHTLLSDLEAAGILAEGSAARALESMSQIWLSDTEHEPREMARGVLF